jgi:DNA-binding HxlR family transcriptional regulator/HEAT repeat protein
MATGQENDKERAEVHDALGHNRRIAILKALSDGPLGFAELKRKLNIDSSGTLQHHLSKMNGLVIKNEFSNYCLSDKGREALLTFQPMEKYNEDARFKEQIGLLIRALRTDIESVREVVVAQLSMFGPKAVTPLKSALHEAISELKDKEGSSSRSYYSGGDDREAPERAVTGLVTALGIISSASTVPDIVQTLPRTEAFEALAKIGNKQALDAVVSSIPTWFKNNAAKLGYDPDRYEAHKAEKLDNFLRKIFNSFDEEGRIALQTAITSETFVGKDVAARILAVVGDDKSIPALAFALEKGDFDTKNETTWALLRLKAKEAVPKVIDELFKTEELLQASKETRYGDSSEYYKAKKTCEVLANVVLMLGTVENWFAVAFRRPRSSFAQPFDYAIINSKNSAIPALTELLKSTDNSIQSAAADMIARIMKGETHEMPVYYSFNYRV